MKLVPSWWIAGGALAIGLYGGWQLEHWRLSGAVAKAQVATATLQAQVSAVRAEAAEALVKRNAEIAAHNAAKDADYANTIQGLRVELERERSSGASRLFAAHKELARLSALSETDRLGRATEIATLTGRVGEIERAASEFVYACRADAAQLIALQAQISPQL